MSLTQVWNKEYSFIHSFKKCLKIVFSKKNLIITYIFSLCREIFDLQLTKKLRSDISQCDTHFRGTSLDYWFAKVFFVFFWHKCIKSIDEYMELNLNSNFLLPFKLTVVPTRLQIVILPGRPVFVHTCTSLRLQMYSTRLTSLFAILQISCDTPTPSTPHHKKTSQNRSKCWSILK